MEQKNRFRNSKLSKRAYSKEIGLDALTRLERLKFMPKSPSMRNLFIQIHISQWLHVHPKPSAQAAKAQWIQDSLFTSEELSIGLEPILIKAFFPIWTHAILNEGKDVENSNLAWPLKYGNGRWFLVAASSKSTSANDIKLFKDHMKSSGNTIDTANMEIMWGKNSILGAIMFEPPRPQNEADSKSAWENPSMGKHAWRITSSLRFCFGESGPSPYFRDCDIVPGVGVSILKQNFAFERLEAIRKKLTKYKFVPVLKNCIRFDEAAPRRKNKRVKTSSQLPSKKRKSSSPSSTQCPLPHRGNDNHRQSPQEPKHSAS